MTPRNHTVGMDEFELFYQRICHTPLGQLTTMQRRILDCIPRRARPSTIHRVFEVSGHRQGNEHVKHVEIVIALTPFHAAQVAYKRNRELGMPMEIEHMAELGGHSGRQTVDPWDRGGSTNG